MPISFRITQDLQRRFEKVSGELGLNQSHILREALEEKLTELEELSVVMKRVKELKRNKKKAISIEQVWEELEARRA